MLRFPGRRTWPATKHCSFASGRGVAADIPALSLGNSDDLAGLFSALRRLRAPSAAGGESARRPSPDGGGAILHDLEVTYSLALPATHPLVTARGPSQLYEMVHAGVLDVLDVLGVVASASGCGDDSGAARGPFFCFERRHRYDLLAAGGKIAGSAQRRTPHGILQHGSIIIGNRFAQQATAATATDASTALDTVQQSLPDALARVAGIDLEPGSWSARELELAGQLTAKYAGIEWTRRA